jgi:hypothetical protein
MLLSNFMFFNFNSLLLLEIYSNVVELLSPINIVIFISSISLITLPLIYLSGHAERLVKGIVTGIGIGIGKLAVDNIAKGSNTSGASSNNVGSNTNSNSGSSSSGDGNSGSSSTGDVNSGSSSTGDGNSGSSSNSGK